MAGFANDKNNKSEKNAKGTFIRDRRLVCGNTHKIKDRGKRGKARATQKSERERRIKRYPVRRNFEKNLIGLVRKLEPGSVE